MANLKEVRDRIKSVQNMQQLTKAMKMVSASKLRKAQTAITQMRPYANKLNQMLRNILANLESGASNTFGQERPVQKACVVVVTSNRGLAGAFNTNIIKAAIETINDNFAEQRKNGNLTLLFIGKKGYDYFKKRYSDVNMITDYVALFDDLSFETVAEVSQRLMDSFKKGEYDRVDVAYGQFKNAATQFTIYEQFLPVPKVEANEDVSLKANYIFEPNKEDLLEYLVPTIIQTTFHKYVLDTHASEHGARMTAMDKATENAEELLRDLKISYNKARQEAITNEILEIVGGAAALESN